jgi:GNAT superfamily N-acetyltransferase
MTLEIRPAQPRDADAVAELHAASWRSAYRGMFTDAYLDGDVIEERRLQWTKHLVTEPRLDQGVFVAMENGACVGFLCIFLEAEPGWGPLLDNLHVRPDLKDRGIGQQLIAAGLAWMGIQGTFDRWHLWVLEDNALTRRVYEHLGWEPRERAIHHAPDGTEYWSWRYVQSLTSAPATP